MKKIELTEYEHCILLADYLNLLQTQGKIKMFSHIPNSTYTTSWNQKRKNKRMGVAPGVPDYMILTNNGLVFIEMKKEKKGVVSQEQQDWIDNLMESGYGAYVARGFNEAKDIVDRYF